MSTIAPANPGVSDLLQILSNSGSSSLSSVLSSSQVHTALQKASPGDIVQLSDQALQLQVSNALFGSPDPSHSNANSPAPSLSSQLGAYQSQLQSEQLQALFETGRTAGNSVTSVNLLA